MPQQPIEPQAPAKEETSLLGRYLAGADVPCPVCRYNLRGCTAAVCPECGNSLSLGIAGRPRHWVPPLLAVLAFGWVLLAGGLNTARNIHLVLEASRPSMLFLSAQRSITLRFNGQSVVTTAPLTLQPTTPAAAPARSWSSVSDTLWARLAWSVFLVIGGAAGLVAVVCHRRRALSERAWRALGVHALVLFAVYGGFHVYTFVEEAMAW